MAMIEARGDAVPDETAAAFLFHGFSDPSRLAILRHLALGEHRVVDLTKHLGLAQSTVSKHLACLRDCGLVDSRPQGRASMFSLTQPEATLAVLESAERLLGLTGDAVALLSHDHDGDDGVDHDHDGRHDGRHDQGKAAIDG
ncbi:ArsR/SmtB family transcription factor [Promicromonospora sp. NPDC057138]|uniref:ArsR/SmtB family transcription factor n=1 Tax=Promicromonospora sp. NPDC057138 TaxID=3346031 RepID=UPI00362BD1C3